MFSEATVYTSLCFAGAEASENVEVAKLDEGSWEVGHVPRSEMLGRKPWDLAVGTNRRIVRHLRDRGERLGNMVRIAKGTGTNADAVFLIESPDSDVESELLHPVLRGRDIRALGSVPSWPRLLLPYDAAGRLLDPETLQQRYPRALAHLLRHQQRLESRESGRFAGDRFYRFGRPQNLAFLLDRRVKVVVPDVTRGGRALIDRSAALVLDSAYALRFMDSAEVSHECLCGILCSKLVRLWLRTQGVPLRGGYTRMKTAYLSDLPIPEASEATRRIGALVRARAALAEIDEHVREAYGLPADLWNHGSR